MDDHLEMAYEDQNGALVSTSDSEGPEELSEPCDECGAAAFVQCPDDCPNYTEV